MDWAAAVARLDKALFARSGQTPDLHNYSAMRIAI
jgi:hypothetical protein